jgi:ribonuclease E
MDRARIQIGRLSRFGLLEMSRQRLRPSLGESSHLVCPRCTGIGSIRSVESMALAILRLIGEEARKEKTAQVVAQVPVEVATYLINEKREWLRTLEDKGGVELLIVPNQYIQTPEYSIKRVRSDEIELPENKLLSYKMPAPPVVTDPSGTKPEKPQLEPAAVVPTSPSTAAPVIVHVPAPAAAVNVVAAPTGLNFWQRLKYLFTGTPSASAAAATPPAREEGRRPQRDRHRDRDRDGRHHRRDGERDRSRDRGAHGRRDKEGGRDAGRDRHRDGERHRDKDGSREAGRHRDGQRDSGPRDAAAQAPRDAQREQNREPNRERDAQREAERQAQRERQRERQREQAAQAAAAGANAAAAPAGAAPEGEPAAEPNGNGAAGEGAGRDGRGRRRRRGRRGGGRNREGGQPAFAGEPREDFNGAREASPEERAFHHSQNYADRPEGRADAGGQDEGPRAAPAERSEPHAEPPREQRSEGTQAPLDLPPPPAAKPFVVWSSTPAAPAAPGEHRDE